jgi:hypothetical protein
VPRPVAAVARPAAQLAPHLARARPATHAVSRHSESPRWIGRMAARRGEPARVGLQRRARSGAPLRQRVRSNVSKLPLRREPAVRRHRGGKRRRHRAVPDRHPGAPRDRAGPHPRPHPHGLRRAWRPPGRRGRAAGRGFRQRGELRGALRSDPAEPDHRDARAQGHAPAHGLTSRHLTNHRRLARRQQRRRA